VATSKLRVIIPDSHGCYINKKAKNAFLKDLKVLDPEEIVMLGDHVDCSGFLSTHGLPGAMADCAYSYEQDIAAANKFLDEIQKAAPNAKIWYIEGNHEFRVERWASATALGKRMDAEGLRKRVCPEHLLDLAGRGITYIRSHEFHHGINIPGTIRLGKCYFTHGISAAKYAAERHLDAFADNVVFGHVHRNQSAVSRKVATGTIGAWSPGCLAELQQLYNHTSPTGHSHGFAVQLVAGSGNFQHIQITIADGVSCLGELAKRM
jgi:UDP-2,3-diacylglucosamine pyrophosphatase LpxH